jgi:HEAT repeat protein
MKTSRGFIIRISIVIVIVLFVILYLIYRTDQRRIELEAQINDLIEKIDSGDWIARKNATYELKDIGCDIIPFLAKAANDTNLENPQRIIEILQNFRFTSDDCVRNLRRALQNTNSEVRSAAMHALAYIKAECSEEFLSIALNDEDRYVRIQALRLLARRVPRNEALVQPIIEILNSEKDCHLIIGAMLALVKHGDQYTADVLIPFLNHDSTSIKRIVAYQLGELKNESTFMPLIGLLGDEDRSVRMAAFEALAKIGDKRAIEPIVNLLHKEETSEYEAMYIREALDELGWNPESDSLAPD